MTTPATIASDGDCDFGYAASGGDDDDDDDDDAYYYLLAVCQSPY